MTGVTRDAARPVAMKAGLFDPPSAAPEFSLQGSDGSEVTLARYRGKVVLLSFGFTYCATVCPTTLATLARARIGLGKAAASVQVIFVTVDPARDDAAHMRDYLAAFDRSFIGATGAPDALAAVREKYGVTAVRHGTGTDYVMAHTSSIFLIDRTGKLRAMMPFGHDPADFVHDVKLLLAE
jgi:protein SCO1